MNFSDSFFKRVEKKTSVSKETILSLAEKLQKNDLKNENTLREVIKELSKVTGKEVSKEKENKIVEAVLNDKVPKNIDTTKKDKMNVAMTTCEVLLNSYQNKIK